MPGTSLRAPRNLALVTLAIAFALFVLLFAVRVAGYYYAIRNGDLGALPQFSDRITRGNLRAESRADPTRVFNAQSPALGNSNATLTLVEFADFECPFSEEVFPAVRRLVTGNPHVRFVFRNFPLDAVHEHAREAARAGVCAAAQGKFWPLHDKLFQNASRLTTTDLKFYAEQIGLDTGAFEACLEAPETEAALNADERDGVAAGVRGTPTFFFNGKKVEGAIPFAVLQQLIAAYSK